MVPEETKTEDHVNADSAENWEAEIAANPWAIIGKNRLPWWLVIAAPVFVDVLALAVLWWEGAFQENPEAARTLLWITTITGALVGGGLWAVDKIQYHWRENLGRWKINSDFFLSLLFSLFFLFLLFGFLRYGFPPNGFQWMEDWFAVVLLVVFGLISIGSFASWAGRNWGTGLYAIVGLAFVLGLSISAAYRLLEIVPLPVRATTSVLLATYLTISFLGFVLLAEGLPSAVTAFAWPVLLLGSKGSVAALMLLIAAIFAGETVGRMMGNAYVGAFGGLAVFAAVAWMYAWRGGKG